MKLLFLTLCLGLLASCSSVYDKRSLSQKIQAEEARSLMEIKSHADFLLERHPKLDEKTKTELSSLLKTTITKQQELKDEESKIFQLLLKKSLKVNHLSDKELDDKNSLKMRLGDVYEKKSKNIIVLINKIVSLSEQNALNDSLKDDMVEMLRDMR